MQGACAQGSPGDAQGREASVPPPALNTRSLSRALQGAGGGGGAPEEVPRASVQAARSPLCLLRALPSL